MQFAKKWSRFVGAGGVTLGSGDPVPTGVIDARDNILQVRFRPDHPAGRLVIGYSAPAVVSPLALTVEAYVYEASSAQWYKLAAASALALNVLSFLPIIGCLSPSSAPPEQQNGNVYIRVIPAGSDPVGEYVFVADYDQRVIAP